MIIDKLLRFNCVELLLHVNDAIVALGARLDSL